ncbi:hypothetical protein J6590_005326 [Homalodisca vitripennis]|nr:hypothetical protein J6590_005326 [Homalodisca vitripennis]
MYPHVQLEEGHRKRDLERIAKIQTLGFPIESFISRMLSFSDQWNQALSTAWWVITYLHHVWSISVLPQVTRRSWQSAETSWGQFAQRAISPSDSFYEGRKLFSVYMHDICGPYYKERGNYTMNRLRVKVSKCKGCVSIRQSSQGLSTLQGITKEQFDVAQVAQLNIARCEYRAASVRQTAPQTVGDFYRYT